VGHYFDHNATTPLAPAAREAWLKVSDEFWHNPSSLYPEAAHASQKLDACRERLARILDCDAERIVFTSGATEANNAVIEHVASSGNKKATTIVGAAEHPCVLHPARSLFGSRCRLLDTDSTGVVNLDQLDRMLSKSRPELVAVMAANNETGTIQPWQKIAEICQTAGVRFHCDAAQWIGKLPARGLGQCDFVTGSAHKFGGPKGIGFLVTPEDEPITIGAGGPQENGRRAGTEDVAGVSAMLVALEEREAALAIDADGKNSLSAPRDAFERSLRDMLPNALVVGGSAARLWNTSMVVLPHSKNLRWLTRLARRGIQVSTGSACSAGQGRPSEVLQAMGESPETMSRVLRVSSGMESTEADWLSLAGALADVERELSEGASGAGSGLS